MYRGQGNQPFNTADSRGPAKRGQTVPYDVNGAPTGGTGAALADGDYGDIIASGGGASLDIDPALLTAYMRTVLAAADQAAARAVLAAQAAHALLDGLAGMGASTGLLEQTGAASFGKRAIGVGAGTSILSRADGDGRYLLATLLGAVGGVASLDGSGLIPTSQLPALAITKPNVVASQAAQLALTAQEGDVAIRTDLNKSYIHNGGTAGTMADWTEILTPTDSVLSVNGETGAVSLIASEIPFTPAGSLAAADVQAALVELDAEKQPLAGNLSAFAALTGIADRLAYFNGAGTMALATFTAAGRAVAAATGSTGTGTVTVFSIAPAFTGTTTFEALTASGNVTLGDATADAHTINGNVTHNVTGASASNYRWINAGQLASLKVGFSSGSTYLSAQDNTGASWAPWVIGGSQINFQISAANVLIARSTGTETIGEHRCDTLRIDVAPTAATPTPTHTIPVNFNGTVYRVPCVI